VFVEFGAEFIGELEAAHLEPSLYYYNVPSDDYAWVAVCKRALRTMRRPKRGIP
jgi:hypothetical protein